MHKLPDWFINNMMKNLTGYLINDSFMYNPHPCADILQGAFTHVNNQTVIETAMKITPNINNYTVNTFRCIDDDNTALYARWYEQQVFRTQNYNKLKFDFVNSFKVEKLDTCYVHFN